MAVMNLGRRHAHGQMSQGKSKDGCPPSPCPGLDQQAAAESAGFYRGRSRSMSWEQQRDTVTRHLCFTLKMEHPSPQTG